MERTDKKKDGFFRGKIFLPTVGLFVKSYEEFEIIKREGFFVKGQTDLALPLTALSLIVFGMIMDFSLKESAAFNLGDSFSLFDRATLMVPLSILLMFIASRINIRLLKMFSPLILLLACLLLLYALASPMTIAGKESIKRFIKVPIIGLNIQPSEFAKYALTLFLASSLVKKSEEGELLKKPYLLYNYMAVAGFFALLVLLGGHMSGAIIILAIGVFMALLSDVDRKWILPWIFLAALALFLFVLVFWLAARGQGSGGIFSGAVSQIRTMASDNEKSSLAGIKMQLLRIYSWLDKDYSPDNHRYQINQALQAIASGGFFGKGYGNSIKKFGYLPESANDFVFSIIYEELGLIGAGFVIGCFVLILWRGLHIADMANSRLESVLVMGLVLQICLHAALHIAIVTDMLPNTGMSLPFISSGGSSLMVNAISIGTVLSVSRAADSKK